MKKDLEDKESVLSAKYGRLHGRSDRRIELNHEQIEVILKKSGLFSRQGKGGSRKHGNSLGRRMPGLFWGGDCM